MIIRLMHGQGTDARSHSGDLLAGLWQYMCQPWSSFREIVFDVVFHEIYGPRYVAYGQIMRFGLEFAGNRSQSIDVIKD